MRGFTKITFGLGAAASIYFSADLLFMSSRHGTPKYDTTKLAHENDALQVERRLLPRELLRPPIAERPATAAPSAAPPTLKQPPDEPPEPDRRAELVARLEGQYAVDAPSTRESASREGAIESLFSQPGLDGKGELQEVTCRERICRGVIKIAGEAADNEVFSRTFLSQRFMGSIQDAVTLGSRQKLSDGTIVATFYIHPQSALALDTP